MADIEMIFPDKVVGVKPFQLFNLIVTMVTALVAGVLVVWRVSQHNNRWWLTSHCCRVVVVGQPQPGLTSCRLAAAKVLQGACFGCAGLYN
jgi:hypothetical protein